MDIIVSIMGFLLFAAIVATLITFGFALFIWMVVMAGVVSLWVFARRAWIRWSGGEVDPQTTITIIEADYKDLSK